jgi:NAD(P) transhydrogenase subunit beta
VRSERARHDELHPERGLPPFLVLYIVAFALFIYGLSGLTGPRTAVRGNRIAAVGMAIAVLATLLQPGEGNWGLIVIGVAIGALSACPRRAA